MFGTGNYFFTTTNALNGQTSINLGNPSSDGATRGEYNNNEDRLRVKVSKSISHLSDATGPPS